MTSIGLAALLSAAVGFGAMALWNAPEFQIPLHWDKGGDALFNVLLAATVEETGWYLEHPRLGAPGVMDLRPWSGSGFLSLATFKLLAVFFSSAGAIVNVFYLLGWPLAGAAATWALLRFHVMPALAVVLGVLFAALPGHLLRGEAHLFLANFALIPPVLVAARQAAVEGFSARGHWYLLLVGFVVSGFEPYYGFFGSFFVLLGSLIGWGRGFGVRRLVPGVLFGFGAVLGLLLTAMPALLYTGPPISQRPALDTELLGLKISLLLLPVFGHRVDALGRLTLRYLETGAAPGLVNENIASALGLVASVGVVLLLFHLLVRVLPSRDPAGSGPSPAFCSAVFCWPPSVASAPFSLPSSTRKFEATTASAFSSACSHSPGSGWCWVQCSSRSPTRAAAGSLRSPRHQRC
ncbi:MAG: hypothetical protein HC897_14805 [Thermoanaerobaculia bacterium]|nr:hypothetical protein [Thermoanaerobaculia bacterium]